MMDLAAQSLVEAVQVVVAGEMGMCIHQVEGSKVPVAALGAEALGAALPDLH